MARWVQCTLLGGKRSTMINLDLVTQMTEQNNGTLISFGGGEDPIAVVENTKKIFGLEPWNYLKP